MTERPYRLADRPRDAGDDVLSDVLRAVRLSGAMVFLVRARAPWRTHAPQARHFARWVLPAAQQLVSFHAVIRGACWGGLDGEPLQRLDEGDVLVVPHGDAYLLTAPTGAPPLYGDDDAVAFFRRMAAGALPTVVDAGGSGPAQAEFLCSFLGCDDRPFKTVLAELPRVVVLHGVASRRRPLGRLLELAVDEARAARDGRREVLRRLSELMFVEVIRHRASDAAAGTTGWLAGLREPVVARALAHLHAEPARPWTLGTLAAAAACSRTTLTERFGRIVERPPMQYLGEWRMQCAAQLLSDPRQKVASVGRAVGYASEASFSRAFRRSTGLAPERWRRR
jgi:AraC-like DNA-binding protein